MCLFCEIEKKIAEARQGDASDAAGIHLIVGGPSQRLTERPETAQDGQESPEGARTPFGLADLLPWTPERLATVNLDAFKKRLREEIGLIESDGLPFSAPKPGRTYATLAAAYILGTLVPEWQELFEAKNAEYGEYDRELGELGETVEIVRKAKKLRRAFIQGADTSLWSETPREVAMDMIGHLFLLIMLLDEDGAGDKPEDDDDPTQKWPPLGGLGV